MKIRKFDSKEEWFAARVGKITGSSLKDITMKRGEGKKIGYYQLIADRLATPSDGEDPMERGTRLETEAIQEFEKEMGMKVDTGLYLWVSDENENIAVSPDGVIDRENAVEVKCLSSARHIEAYLTKKVLYDYEFQVLQYFIVNPDLQNLYFCFYDPRLTVKPFFYLTITRESVQDEVEEYLEHEKKVLEEVERVVLELSF